MVVVQSDKIPHFVRDDNPLKYVISSEARNLSDYVRRGRDQTEPLPAASM